MFSMNEIQYEDLCYLKQKYDLEIELFLYEDISNINEVLYKDTPVGVFIFNKYLNGVLIDYFEIFKKERNKQLGRKFILKLIEDVKEDLKYGEKLIIYLTPLPEKIKFWQSCGFSRRPNDNSMLIYEYVSIKR
ncbi:GNAT family N-acetyltransferase [Clostridium beijerinckii]|uniref:GNAT superfamily N-acetyltransferase n=1 Tax=Clostridium beijerinckii TaxID=1520 RepID=A0AAE5H6Z7_CLOBE|nr:GNAT family N-acetyltransferase [Clostridium beijerinckii]NSB15958.1 GNAT superfamily N-acetyltransferase [Clostridium beijerinckii]OOM33286.1 hypothetical protein CLOBE_06240 [Clostridium beijerinckii]